MAFHLVHTLHGGMQSNGMLYSLHGPMSFIASHVSWSFDAAKRLATRRKRSAYVSIIVTKKNPLGSFEFNSLPR